MKKNQNKILGAHEIYPQQQHFAHAFSVTAILATVHCLFSHQVT